jgi:hypothetical protein
MLVLLYAYRGTILNVCHVGEIFKFALEVEEKL